MKHDKRYREFFKTIRNNPAYHRVVANQHPEIPDYVSPQPKGEPSKLQKIGGAEPGSPNVASLEIGGKRK